MSAIARAGYRRSAWSRTCGTGRQKRVVAVQAAPSAPPAAERDVWQSSVRSLTGRRHHRFWEPQLDPPALLADVSVVLVSPKRPISVGTVARALSCFECEDLRIVEPRCDHLARASRNGSKGAQYIIWRAQLHDTLASALADATVSVAFTRWVAGRPNAFRSIDELLASQLLAAALAEPASPPSSISSASTSNSSSSSISFDPHAASGLVLPSQQQPVRRPRLALVFGREERGFDAGELDCCDCTCSIPIGRLQESLSLSHAVSIVLSQLFQLRQRQGGYSLPTSAADLAAGYQEDGPER